MLCMNLIKRMELWSCLNTIALYIWWGDMIDSLDNPIQFEYNDLIVNLGPKLYDSNNNKSHSITFPDGTSIPVE